MGSDEFSSNFGSEEFDGWDDGHDFDSWNHGVKHHSVRESPPLEIILPVVFFVVFVIFFITCCIAAIIRKRDEERRRANITYTSPIITPGYPNYPTAMPSHPHQYGGQPPSFLHPTALTTVSGGGYSNFLAQQSDLPPSYEEATHQSLDSGNKTLQHQQQAGLVGVLSTVPSSGHWQQQQPGWVQQ